MSPHPPSWKSILILSSHLRLCFPSGPFPTGFPTSSVPYTRYMAHPLNSSRFDHTHFISWGIQIIKFLIILFCPLPFYIDTFGPKYSPQHPILKHPQSPFLPQCERPCFTPVQNNRKKYNFVYLDLHMFGQQTGSQKCLHRLTASIPSFSLILFCF